MDGLITNPFDDSGFDLATMTQAVNLIPNNYGRVRELGLFTLDPVRTRTIIVDEINGLLTLLKTQPLGSPAPRAKHPKAKSRSFIIPHIPYEDQIFPSDIQGRRDPGSTDVKTLAKVMADRLTQMRASLAITEEYLMMGALKGVIDDADGTTIQNLISDFGLAPQVKTFALSTTTTDVKQKCRDVVRLIEDSLMGDVMSHVHCLCDENFFDQFIAHESVEELYLGHEKALELAGSKSDPRKGFTIGGITFEEYRAKATDPTTGSLRPFIAENNAHFFPIGTQNTFKLHHAPADHMETVNTFGQPIYAWQTMDPKGKFVDITTESNPLPMCRRPGVLVNGISN